MHIGHIFTSALGCRGNFGIPKRLFLSREEDRLRYLRFSLRYFIITNVSHFTLPYAHFLSVY